MPVRLHPNDPLPLYRQLVRQIRLAVAAGDWKPGERIPSHRDLARDLVVNALTVKKAYDLLIADGLLQTRPGQGTYVAADAARDTRPGDGECTRALSEAVAAARRLRWTRAAFNRRVDALWTSPDAADPSSDLPSPQEGDPS